MQFLYSLGILAYQFSISLAAIFSDKAKLWKEGRKGIFEKISASISDKDKIVWFHCASLGEFEQGRPLIEAYKQQFPQEKILLTFFSPSGYEVRKNYEKADFVFYLPMDTVENAARFLDLLKPQKVFFIKYEFWFNYLSEIKLRDIPCFLVSGVFREDQLFFKAYGKWALEKLKAFHHFFLQNEKSAELLNKHGLDNYSIVGDTRFDRVLKIAEAAEDLPEIKKFCKDNMLAVFGSSWPDEDKMALRLINDGEFEGKIIIAPHEISESKSQYLLDAFGGKAVLWSDWKEGKEEQASPRVLIINAIGILSSIYQYGNLAVIGGGFGKGVHNVLEAATFGLPIFIGSNYQKFQEVKELISLGAAESSENTNELLELFMKTYNSRGTMLKKSQLAKDYIKDKAGATAKIMKLIKEK